MTTAIQPKGKTPVVDDMLNTSIRRRLYGYKAQAYYHQEVTPVKVSTLEQGMGEMFLELTSFFQGSTPVCSRYEVRPAAQTMLLEKGAPKRERIEAQGEEFSVTIDLDPERALAPYVTPLAPMRVELRHDPSAFAYTTCEDAMEYDCAVDI